MKIHPVLSIRKLLFVACILIITSPTLSVQVAHAQGNTDSTQDGIDVLVNPSAIKRVVIAVPNAFNLGDKKR